MAESTAETEVTLRRILALAVPALGVLAAEPLYVLIDTAVVGHLGAVPLAGLALGGTMLSVLTSQLTFLSYGTTARTSRLYGANRRAEAVAEGGQATWLAIAVGVLVFVLGELFAHDLAQLLAGRAPIADAATEWLRIALLGAPAILITLAGNGWMRGVQDTVRPLRYVLAANIASAIACPILVYPVGLGLAGSAIANVIAQTIAAILFVIALWRERAMTQPSLAVMRAQMVLGRDLILRSASFQICFLSAAAVAARYSAAAAGAHQIVYELWSFLSLVLDSLAIAAQALIGAALGSERTDHARAVAWQITGYSLLLGIALGALFAAAYPVLPHAFTDDAAVLAQIPYAWWLFVVQQPVAGIVFALDGVLLGAGDTAFLRTTTLGAALLGFLPLIWLSYAFGWGLLGIWAGLTVFLLARLVATVWRTHSGAWAIGGA
ncbi:MATE family efflux transporter [Salinisphaera hydrothermalis]|uniref:DNA-damage-inducible protein F n=1 Tax=Salinisphaera hydrothermalis (strain C41B8) TaxID=1304275 RepID=A0A084IKV6_SALHC|nr:MATE family efflux transporter [Salinisphaera hydrothermalis]KEZ77340.1 DNA-damage-inducible protein F [Salinisphaera hydrothermalis C41B8]